MKFLLLVLFLILNAPTLAFAEPIGTKHYKTACFIYDENFKPLRSFSGERCVFMDDGSFVTINAYLQTIEKYSPEGDLQWRRKKEYTNHQASLSFDKKRLLILSSEAVHEKVCYAHYIVLLILDVKTGKTVARKSLRDDRKLLFEKTGKSLESYGASKGMDEDVTKVNCHGTLFNGFNEIPTNSMAAENPAFSEGNYILTNYDSKYAFIIDKALKKIVWSGELYKGESSPFHNAQVRPDGLIMAYVGEFKIADGTNHFAVIKYDPRKQTTAIILPDNPALRSKNKPQGFTHSIRAGSVQAIKGGYLIGHNDANRGGHFLFTDFDGNILKSVPNPATDPASKHPATLQDVLELDLSQFLQNYQL